MSNDSRETENILKEFTTRSLDQLSQIQSSVDQMRSEIGRREARMDESLRRIDREFAEIKGDVKELQKYIISQDEKIKDKVVKLQVDSAKLAEKTSNLEQEHKSSKMKRGAAAAGAGGFVAAAIQMIEWLIRNI